MLGLIFAFSPPPAQPQRNQGAKAHVGGVGGTGAETENKLCITCRRQNALILFYYCCGEESVGVGERQRVVSTDATDEDELLALGEWVDGYGRGTEGGVWKPIGNSKINVPRARVEHVKGLFGHVGVLRSTRGL